MDRRHEFVLEALVPGANISALCREYGIARPTAYKWLKRYREHGLRGLEDQRRGPRGGRSELACSADMALEVLHLRRLYPTWGPKKLRQVLLREYSAQEVPSSRTISRVLRRAGLSTPRRRRQRRNLLPGQIPNVRIEGCNDLWTVDFKGWWKSRGDRRRCEPLTIRDAHSRFIFAVRLLEGSTNAEVRAVFAELFAYYGLPRTILSDNGIPFAAHNSLLGLTKLSAWWMALGIEVVRARKGCPQDNGGHERMHRDLKADLQRHPAWTKEEQQLRCDRWRHTFNDHRPHEALGGQTPASVYVRSHRLLPAVEEQPVYPDDYVTRRVSKSGAVRYMNYQRTLSQALAGYDVGIEPLPDNRFRVWFAGTCLGHGRLPWKSPIQPLRDTTSTHQIELDL